jgi:hypothetical protein
LCLLGGVVAHAADIQDRDGAGIVIQAGWQAILTGLLYLMLRYRLYRGEIASTEYFAPPR